MANAILDPTGTAVRKVASMAPRGTELQGATVGLLENHKQNAALFLQELGDLLVERHGVARVVMSTKGNFAAPLPDDQREELAGQCDFVVTGVGDCGSCSAGAVMDGVTFETRGIPAAVICSEAFTRTADAMAEVQGATGYRYVVTRHPVASLTPPEVRERAERALPEVISLLTSEGSTARQGAA